MIGWLSEFEATNAAIYATQRQDEIAMKTGSMNRLFFHIYMWVLVAAFLGIAGTEWLGKVVYDREETQYHRDYLATIHPFIVEALLKTPRHQWRGALNDWSSITEYELRVVGIDDAFWERENRAKPDGNTPAFDFHTTFISDYLSAAYPIPGTDQVLLYDHPTTGPVDHSTVDWDCHLYTGQAHLSGLPAAAIHRTALWPRRVGCTNRRLREPTIRRCFASIQPHGRRDPAQNSRTTGHDTRDFSRAEDNDYTVAVGPGHGDRQS